MEKRVASMEKLERKRGERWPTPPLRLRQVVWGKRDQRHGDRELTRCDIGYPKRERDKRRGVREPKKQHLAHNREKGEKVPFQEKTTRNAGDRPDKSVSVKKGKKGSRDGVPDRSKLGGATARISLQEGCGGNAKRVNTQSPKTRTRAQGREENQ